jgi:hypothetical protein
MAQTIKFPRKLVKIGDCLAVLGDRGEIKGQPITNRRPLTCYNGQVWLASRLSFHLNVKSIDKNKKNGEGYVCHECDNFWCVNPNHLYLGTAKNNHDDFVERNRAKYDNIISKLTSRDARIKSGLSQTGKKFSEETRKKMAEAKIGKKRPKEVIDKIKAYQNTDEAKAIKSHTQKTRIRSIQEREKRSASVKASWVLRRQKAT